MKRVGGGARGEAGGGAGGVAEGGVNVGAGVLIQGAGSYSSNVCGGDGVYMK